ncbi:hypothetical protein DFJ77DRAFT_202454 [Powellomyces hirtus]|nr:hypothetical protein DFJ77DRAFT_202454 [Powellomyces hirtus]
MRVYGQGGQAKNNYDMTSSPSWLAQSAYDEYLHEHGIAQCGSLIHRHCPKPNHHVDDGGIRIDDVDDLDKIVACRVDGPAPGVAKDALEHVAHGRGQGDGVGVVVGKAQGQTGGSGARQTVGGGNGDEQVLDGVVGGGEDGFGDVVIGDPEIDGRHERQTDRQTDCEREREREEERVVSPHATCSMMECDDDSSIDGVKSFHRPSHSSSQ